MQPMPDLLLEDEPDPYSTALFFDFDGTLVAIEEQPDQVSLRAETVAALEILADVLDGAVAILSGRPVGELTSFLDPLRLPLAGVHGLETSDVAGTVTRHSFDQNSLAMLVEQARSFAAPHAGLLVEAKPGSVALHFRRRPELEAAVVSFAKGAAASVPGAGLILGKMVAELRLGGRTKADALSHFMAVPPFAGRTPWFFGDDVTDEDGFSRANELGGRSFRIGEGRTLAMQTFADFETFQHWLTATANRLSTKAIPGSGS